MTSMDLGIRYTEMNKPNKVFVIKELKFLQKIQTISKENYRLW